MFISYTWSHFVVECLVLDGELPQQYPPGVVRLQGGVRLDGSNGAGESLQDWNFNDMLTLLYIYWIVYCIHYTILYYAILYTTLYTVYIYTLYTYFKGIAHCICV